MWIGFEDAETLKYYACEFIPVKISRKLKAIIAVNIAIIVIISVLIALALTWDIWKPSAPSEPWVHLGNDDSEDSGTWLVEVYSVSDLKSLSSFEVVLMKNGSLAIIADSLDAVGSICSGSPGMSFVDVQGDGKLNGGDWFVVCGTDSVSEYQVQIFWRPTGNKVSGDTGYINRAF